MRAITVNNPDHVRRAHHYLYSKVFESNFSPSLSNMFSSSHANRRSSSRGAHYGVVHSRMFTTKSLRHKRLPLGTRRSLSLELQLDTQRQLIVVGTSQEPYLSNTQLYVHTSRISLCGAEV